MSRNTHQTISVLQVTPGHNFSHHYDRTSSLPTRRERPCHLTRRGMHAECLLWAHARAVSGLTRANRLVTCFEPLEDVASGVGEVGVEGEALAVDLDGR